MIDPSVSDSSSALSADDFETLFEASRALAGTLDLPVLLRTVMELATRVVRAESSSLLLVDEKTGELVFNVVLGEAGDRVKTVRLKPGEGLAGWVAAHGIARVSNDVQNDPRWTARVDQRSDFVTRQVVAVPLVWQGRLIGVVEGINKKGAPGFTSLDRRALEIFSAQAAIAIENARLFARVREEKETLTALFDTMSEGVLLADERGRVILLNPAGAGLLGGGEEEVVGRGIAEVTRAFEACPSWKKVLVSRAPQSVTLVRQAGKKRVLEGTVQPLKERTHTLFLFGDVTELRQEEWLKQNFLATISHKLKTPLVTILGFAPLLLEDKSLTALQRQSLEAIRDQGKKLKSLVEKLLNLATVEAHSMVLDRRRWRARALLEDLCQTFSAVVARDGVDLVLDESLDALPALSVDRDRFLEALRHLVENAIKFNPKPKKRVRVFARREGSLALISVEDEGPGIASEEHTRIFQKFYQVEDSFTGQVEGPGVGLPLAKRIVEVHGGFIRVRSVLGSGSVFTTAWPLDD